MDDRLAVKTSYSELVMNRCMVSKKKAMIRWDLYYQYGYGSIPINTIFRGMNIHLPAILMFTRGTRF